MADRSSSSPRARGSDDARRAFLRRAVAAAGTTVLGMTTAGKPHAALRHPVTSRSIRTTDGVKLALLETGRQHAGEGATSIVLVPGWCMPASIWMPQLVALGERHHVSAMDPRGQGSSDVPATGYTADRRADDIADVLKGHRRVVLVGWSLGALETLHYVRRHGRGKLAGLMLVDSSVGEPPVPPSSSGFLDGLKRDRSKTIDDFSRAIFRTERPPAEIEAIRASMRRMPLEASVALLSYPYPREHWKKIAHAYKGPLAYVVTPQFFAQADNLAKNRPGTRVERFPNAGHALFVDEAERFNDVLEQFAAPS
jgi:microsomal epoxide hydrolase